MTYHHSIDWLSESQLAPYVDTFKRYLNERRYTPQIVNRYIAGITHFARWLSQSQLHIHQINEEVVLKFFDEHLPHCNRTKPIIRDKKTIRAAINHLLFVLRANAVIAEPPVCTTPVGKELRDFDDYINHVRGLAQKTRSQHLGVVERLLIKKFAEHPVVISAITPDDIRKFVIAQSELCGIPSSIGATVAALRGYFRYRTTRGDLVHHLIGVTSYPANWQLASLPKALTHNEIDRLVAALDHDGVTARRNSAIVHCALDLGLRSGEVANIGLDDIDWRNATITLRKTKGRREDVMPLPAATGRAIADYLKFERPMTSNRAVFVRNIAPRDQPIGPHLIRKAIRQAYARAGLPYTRAHLLRHTMASRLLEGGSSLKEVADVLRHRSLNTTLIYAKLDSRELAAVALPWPGSAS